MTKEPCAVVEQGLMGLSGLFGQVGATATGHAQSADKQGGQKGGPDVVAHGVGDGHMQRVAVEEWSKVSPATVSAGISSPETVNCGASTGPPVLLI